VGIERGFLAFCMLFALQLEIDDRQVLAHPPRVSGGPPDSIGGGRAGGRHPAGLSLTLGRTLN
jgi:hypothetical protein